MTTTCRACGGVLVTKVSGTRAYCPRCPLGTADRVALCVAIGSLVAFVAWILLQATVF